MVKKSSEIYLVNWVIWDRSSPNWRPICKFAKCSTEQKAQRLKTNLLKQTSFIEVYITKL